MSKVWMAVVGGLLVGAMVSVAEEAAKASGKVLSIKDGKAVSCACAADCKCTVSADNPAKCSCGKDIKSESVVGKFVCETCKTIADKAGKCATCGKDLVEVKAKEAVKAPDAEAPKAQ